MTCKDGSISWSITQHSPPPCTSASTTPSSTSFPSPLSNLDWSSDGVAVESIITQIRAFPIPCPFQANTDTNSSHDNGKTKVTLGDLIDKTSRDKMAKVVVEERMFDTWYYCRTILIGDGKARYVLQCCHTLLLFVYLCVRVSHALFSSLKNSPPFFFSLSFLFIPFFCFLNEACHKVSCHNCIIS